MACLDCSYPLDGLRSTSCPECGRTFDPTAADTFKRVLPDPVELGKFEIAKAYTMCMMLESRGIPAAVYKIEEGIIGQTHIPSGAIWVDRVDRQRARDLVQTTPHTTEHQAEGWKCPCGEQLEAQFDICWSCGSTRPAD